MTTDQEQVPASVLSKLNRAHEHVESLANESAVYVRDSLKVRRVLENGGRDHVFLWESYSPPPERLGLIVGDAVHNVRSALDHMVLILATSGASESGLTISSEVESALQFPICDDPGTFDKKKTRQLKHLAEADISYIMALQPFTLAPADPHMHFLARIRDLDNMDKHRRINVPVLLRRDLYTDWPAGLSWTVRDSDPGGAAEGAEVARFQFPTPEDPLKVPITPVFSVMLPGVGSYEPAESVLTRLIENVDALLLGIVSGMEAHGRIIIHPDAL